MSATITASELYRTREGGSAIVYGKLRINGTYAQDETVSFKTIAKLAVDPKYVFIEGIGSHGYIARYDPATKRIRLFVSDNANTAAAPLVELAALSTVTNIDFHFRAVFVFLDQA